MAADISVGIGVLGETEFKKALTACQNTLKQLDSGLKANAAEFEANADAMGNNAERAQLLKRTLEEQRKLERALGEAVEYAAGEYGEASAQTTKYVVAQNRAREAIAKVEKELKDADREMEELGRDSIRVGRQLENGIGDGAQDAAKSLGEMYDELKNEIDSIGGMVGVELFADIAGGIGNIVTGTYDFVDSTREYRREMSYLEQNARNAGLEMETVEDAMIRVASITGEADGAMEGINNLLALSPDAQELAQVADLLTAAAIKMPGTIKFEELASSFRETVDTKTAVGQFAEVLENLNVDIEDFNKAMEQTTTPEAAWDVAASFIANRGMEQQLAEYEQVNELMIESQTAALQLEAAWAKLGGTLERWITPVTQIITQAIEAVNTYLTEGVNAGALKVQEMLGSGYSTEELEAAAEASKDLREEQERLLDEMMEAFESGNNRRGWELSAQYDELIKEIAETEAEAMTRTGEEAGQALIEETTKVIEDGEESMKTAMDNNMTEINNAVVDGGEIAVTSMDAVMEAMQSEVDSFTTQHIIDEMNRLNNLANPVYVPESSRTGGKSGGRNEDAAPTMQVTLNLDGTKVATGLAKPMSYAMARLT